MPTRPARPAGRKDNKLKLTKSRLKQIIKEAIGDPRTEEESIDYHLMRHQKWLGHLYSEFKRLNQDVNELRLTLNDFMTTKEKPSRWAEPEVVQAPLGRSSGPEELTMSEIKLTKSRLKQIIKEELFVVLEKKKFDYEGFKKNQADARDYKKRGKWIIKNLGKSEYLKAGGTAADPKWGTREEARKFTRYYDVKKKKKDIEEKGLQVTIEDISKEKAR